MSLALLGRCGFEDAGTPLKGKNEWGVDTLMRKVSGARSLAEAYIATLAQGQAYQGYYLQTWEPDDDPQVATIALFYKGFLTGGTPVPIKSSEIITAIGQTTSDFSTEVDPDLPAGSTPTGRKYRSDLLWSFSTDVPSGEIIATLRKGYRVRYALTATMEFTYKSVQTRYRYITVGRPFAPTYNVPDIPYPPIIDRARIILSDGTVLPQRNWDLFFNLTPTVINENISFTTQPVLGTPFFENEDIARRILGNAPE